MTLLEQLRGELPGQGHYQRVYWPEDLVEAQRIAANARRLELKSVVFLLRLERFEPRPELAGPKRDSYDVLLEALRDVEERLMELPPIDRSREKSSD